MDKTTAYAVLTALLITAFGFLEWLRRDQPGAWTWRLRRPR